MKGLSVLAGVIAFLCMVMGIITFFGPGFLAHFPAHLASHELWFWLSALLFLATIALRLGRSEE
jgi:hypothetical protein